MHFEEFTKPSIELFELLKKNNFSIKVFDFTVDEVVRVVAAYPRHVRKYPSNVRVNSIHSILKQRGWSFQNSKEFISNIDKILSDKGISIEWTGLDMKNYNPKNEDYRKHLGRAKRLQPILSQNHDIAAIEKIQEIRKHPRRRITDSKAIFLSSDGRLCNSNFSYMGHRDKNTISEVILDKFFTNMLWLMDPNIEVSLESIIAVCSRDLFVKKRVWERFSDVLSEAMESGDVESKDISVLFWHHYIEDELSEFDEKDADTFDQNFITHEIEKATEFADLEHRRELDEKMLEVEQLYKAKIQNLKDQNLEKWAEKDRIIQ